MRVGLLARPFETTHTLYHSQCPNLSPERTPRVRATPKRAECVSRARPARNRRIRGLWGSKADAPRRVHFELSRELRVWWVLGCVCCVSPRVRHATAAARCFARRHPQHCPHPQPHRRPQPRCRPREKATRNRSPPAFWFPRLTHPPRRRTSPPLLARARTPPPVSVRSPSPPQQRHPRAECSPRQHARVPEPRLLWNRD
mmetsp:Transcript_4228/g.15577  ORF Transcript_4228/g.15577 Transcript_4228/m.15577 type:complete len:200 (+) Transcript_4228:5075-5674(+)